MGEAGDTPVASLELRSLFTHPLHLPHKPRNSLEPKNLSSWVIWGGGVNGGRSDSVPARAGSAAVAPPTITPPPVKEGLTYVTSRRVGGLGA